MGNQEGISHESDMNNSKIAQVIISRLRALNSLKDETAHVEHGSSMGQIRELRLLNILKSYLPNDIGVETGFVCDVAGGISPQIDIIITDIDPIPILDFDDTFKLVPVEKVICCIEVKSTLQTNDLTQVIEQESIIQKMPRCMGNANEGAGKIPQVLFAIFALDNKVGSQVLENTLSDNHWIRQISVVGQIAYRNRSWESVQLENVIGNSEFIETRRSIAWLLNMINDVQKNRLDNYSMASRRTSWQSYLGSDIEEMIPR